jgi:DNA-binding IclR family transcriptional regulator
MTVHRDFTPPRSAERVLTTIRTLAQHGQPMSLAELSTEVKVPKTSLFALLKALQLAGYVTFERDRYALGRESHRLGRAIVTGQSFAGVARPVLERLGRATRETIILCALAEDRRHVVYVDVVEAESQLRFSVNVGTRRPLNASASGQAVLAAMPAAERDAYIEAGDFVRYTPRTVATRTALRAAVAKAKREGCAMTVDGSVDGGVGISAALFDRDGGIVGALVIAAPTMRIIDRAPEIKATVKEGAHAISQLLGYTAATPR